MIPNIDDIRTADSAEFAPPSPTLSRHSSFSLPSLLRLRRSSSFPDRLAHLPVLAHPRAPSSLHHSSSSVASLAHSEGDVPHYFPTLVQEPSVESVHVPKYFSTLVQEPSVIDPPSQSDIIIAVMGPTGAGKSTFINKAAGIEEGEIEEIGHSLEPRTRQIQIVRCLDTQQNRRIVFIDTPGFNDTNILDLDILRAITDWLKLTYEKDIRLSGLLFFHRISDNRIGWSPIKHLKMFQNLCDIENVVLVTTMWDEVGEEEGSNREDELTTSYWNTMIELGCHTSRFYNNTESALDIVSQFQDARCTVLLQKELVDLHPELTETSAGRTLFSSLVEFIKKIKEHLAHIKVKLKQNQDSANRMAVEQDKANVFRRFISSRQVGPSQPVNARRPLVPATSSHLPAPDDSSNTASCPRIANVHRRRHSFSSRVFKRFSSSRPSKPVNARRPLVSATPSCLPAPDGYSNTVSCPEITPVVETLRATSPADATRTHMVLQGTITALKFTRQVVVGLAPLPGLQCLVGVVLNISEVVNNMYTAEDALVKLARKAGSFMVILVEQGSFISSTFSDSDSTVKSVIEELTKEMNLVLGVVNKISSQGSPTRLLLSASDKATVDGCNRQMALAFEMLEIQIAFISPKAIAQIEAEVNLAFEIHQDSNKQTTAQ